MSRSRLKIWIMASRPKTLWAAVSPVLIGSVMAVRADGFHLAAAFAALIGAMMIQIGTNFANDYFDYRKGTDRSDRLGPTRVTQAGLVAPETMKRAVAVAFTLAAVAGLYLIWRGGWPILIIGVLSILFGILYTAGPYPLGYHGLGELFVLVFFGPVAVGGTYYVQVGQIGLPILVAGLSPGLFSVAILTVNNLRDIETDRSSGKRTLAVVFGRTFARLEYVAVIVTACAIPALLTWRGYGSVWLLLSLIVIPVAVPAVRTVLSNTDGEALNDVLASTGRLLLLFSILFCAGWML
ncbi:MAG: 1,4-dihydroxy-2-naphthoate polyprenyltransferase [Candidatus Zixiibacteriota bacterium]|nr:MAG: 1,4-dihydroxy-2-naphthoate polyprenyltransferase [candidate division Zixibacteria bacterium]